MLFAGFVVTPGAVGLAGLEFSVDAAGESGVVAFIGFGFGHTGSGLSIRTNDRGEEEPVFFIIMIMIVVGTDRNYAVDAELLSFLFG